jgi:lysophospholipase L1-like esterase
MWYRYQTNDAGLPAMRKEHLGELLHVTRTQSRRIVIMGDSQVQNAEWSELLDLDSVEVLNRGISGDHLRGMHDRLSQVVALQPDMVFLWGGVNDLFFGHSPESVLEMYARLVVDLHAQCPNTKVVICGIAPVQTSVKHMPITSAPIRATNVLLRGLANTQNCDFLDIERLLSDEKGDLSPKFTLDGVHLTHMAYTLIKQQMQSLIKAHTTYGI